MKSLKRLEGADAEAECFASYRPRPRDAEKDAADTLSLTVFRNLGAGRIGIIDRLISMNIIQGGSNLQDRMGSYPLSEHSEPRRKSIGSHVRTHWHGTALTSPTSALYFSGMRFLNTVAAEIVSWNRFA